MQLCMLLGAGNLGIEVESIFLSVGIPILLPVAYYSYPIIMFCITGQTLRTLAINTF